MRQAIGVLIPLLLFSSGTSAATKDSWPTFKQHYDSARFEQALEMLKKSPQQSFAYYYNAGATYFRLQNYASARAYFERANQLQRHDSDTQHNLELTYQRLRDNTGTGILDPADSWSEKIGDRLSLDEVRSFIGIFSFLLALGLIRVFLKSRSVVLAFTWPSNLIGAIILLLAVGIYLIQRNAESNPPAVLLQSQSIRSGPGDNYMELGRLAGGIKVRLTGTQSNDEQSDNWVQIRYTPQGVGWIRAKSLLRLL